MVMRYKTEPPAKPAIDETETMIGGKKPVEDLAEEDNFTIQVWERRDGKFLGHCLKTTLGGIMQAAWSQAIDKYPGRYLAQTNGPFLINDVVAPSGDADIDGWIPAGSVRLKDLPQWFGLVARCACGNINHVDRYDAKIMQLKFQSLASISDRLTCTECRKGKRPRSKIELGLYKLPR